MASAVADAEAVATEARVVLVVAAARSRVVGEASGVGAAVGVAAVGVLAPHLTEAETAPQARRWPDGARRPCCGVLPEAILTTNKVKRFGSCRGETMLKTLLAPLTKTNIN